MNYEYKPIAEFLDQYKDQITQAQAEFIIKGYAKIKEMHSTDSTLLEKMLDCLEKEYPTTEKLVNKTFEWPLQKTQVKDLK